MYVLVFFMYMLVVFQFDCKLLSPAEDLARSVHFLYPKNVLFFVGCSVGDPWHFGADPDLRILYLWLMDPDPDPNPFFSDLKDVKKIFFK